MEGNLNNKMELNNQLVSTKAGISKERIKNIEKIALIEELIKLNKIYQKQGRNNQAHKIK